MVMKRIRTVAEDTASALGCRAEVRIIPITPAVVNDAGLVARLDGICRRVLPDCTIDTACQTLASDDMAMFMQDIPGCYVMVGAKTGQGFGHHHPRFEIEEQAMVQGVLILVNGVGELGDR
jgi:amidohydrolase